MATRGEEKVGYSLATVGTLTLEETTDKYPYYISIVVCQDKIVVLDFHTDKVYIHGLHDGKFLAWSGSLESWPRDMCLMDAMTICVIHYRGLIKMMSIDSTDMSRVMKTTRTLRLQGVLLNEYHGVVRFKDSLVVTGVKQGMMYWCIVSLKDGHVDRIHQICKGDGKGEYGWCRVTTKDNIIYISCRAGYKSPDTGVYGFDILNPSQCKYKYKHQRLHSPTSIVINEDGNIFVCNYGDPEYYVYPDYCIHQLTASCQLVAIFTQGIPLYLYAIFWDNGHLYGTCRWSPDITVFSHMYQGSHKASEVLVSDERKQPLIEETAIQIGQGNVPVEKGQSSVETEMPPFVPVPEETEGKQGQVFYVEGKTMMEREDRKKKEKQEKVTEKRKIKKEETFGPTDELASAPKKMKAPNMQNQDEFLEAIRNNDQKIEEIIRNQKIPKANTMEEAIRQYGYSQGVRCFLIEMSKLLREQISDAVSVWCGYEPEKPGTPVFVVTLKNQKCILDTGKIPEPFIEYKIIPRYNYVHSNEERSIFELCGRTSVRPEDVAHVNNCIAMNSQCLMREHSNLSIIRACSVKARGYKTKLKVEKDTCIVFYVPVKGIIPVGENKLPNIIDDIVTDVREGEFTLFADHKALEYHPKLRMGCCINRCTCQADECKKGNSCKFGTLGGFIDLPDKKVGCLTAAHVVLVDSGIQTYIQNSDEGKRINSSLAEGELLIQMHQPIRSLGHKPFGKVKIIALEEGNIEAPSVDAAILQITDEERMPETGWFPDGDFADIFHGLTKEDPLVFTTGTILDETEINQEDYLVIKFGCVTGLTSGCLNKSESCVRQVTMDSKYCFPIMFRQLEVQSNNLHLFAANGDSGALVFLCVGGNIRNLRAVGMVIGGSITLGTCVVTPIKAIFNKFGLENNRFKLFPACQRSEFTEGTRTQSQRHSNLNDVYKSVSEKISSVEKSISNRLRILENDVSEIKKSLNNIREPK